MSDEQHVEAAPPYASWWYAAGVSGYAWPETWQVWAARAIASSPAPAAWVIAMSKANCIADLRLALAEQMAIEHVDPNKIGDALLGYVWLRYERKELQFFDCLSYAISKAEDHQTSIDSRAIYFLLNNLSWNIYEMITAMGKKMFRDCKAKAVEQWANITCQ